MLGWHLPGARRDFLGSLTGSVVKKGLLFLLPRAGTTPAVMGRVHSGEKLFPVRSCAVTAKFFVTHRGFSLFSPRCNSTEGKEKAGLEQEQPAKLPTWWRL